MAGVNRMSDEWQSEAFRMSMVKRLEEAIQEHGLQGQKDPQQMEQQIFMRAKTREDYLNCIARFILVIRSQRNNAGGQLGGPVASNMVNAPGGSQINQQEQGVVGMNNSGNTSGSSNIMPQFPVPPQQLQPGSQQQVQQQQINMQQQVHPQMQINQQMMRQSQLQHRLGQGMRLQNQQGMPVMMQQNVSGNRMPQGSQQPGISMTTTPASIMNVTGTSQAPPLYQVNPSQGMPQIQGSNTSNLMQPGPSPGGFIQSPAPNQSMMSPSPITQGPRSVGSPQLPYNQSIATPQQSDASHDQRQDEHAYLEKVKQLGKYIEPLRRMIARIGNEDQEKLGKMNKLMDILSNPNKRMPMETLLKCEAVLEKMNLDTTSQRSTTERFDQSGNENKTSYTIPSPSASGINPLLDAVIKLINAHQKAAGSPSPSALPLNHTLHRSFAPLEAIYGPEISVPSISEIRKSSSSFRPEQESSGDIPDVIQGEVAKLQSHFKVHLDASQPTPNFSEIYTVCQLEDIDLPSVPSLNITIPRNYPDSASPICGDLVAYETTPFLNKVKDALMARMAKLPHRHSLSQLLSAWEMSVRAACSLRQLPTLNAKGS